MKRKITFLLCMICSIITLGQNQRSLEEITCTPPKFTGINGTVPILLEQKYPTIENYLAGKMTYPEEAKRLMQQGTVVVRFLVTPEGKIADTKIINSVSNEIDEEVINVLATTNGMWKPGFNNEKPVAMETEVSIAFRLEGIPHNDFYQMGRKYFSQGAITLFNKESPKKALRFFDKGIVLLPNEKGLLALRGLTRFELGDRDGALRDWQRIKSLGGFEGNVYLEKFGDFKGYAEMITTIQDQ